MHITDIAQQWLLLDPDPQTHAELRELIAKHDITALTARFDGRLRFGTAGLRAILGAGPKRMNRVVMYQTAWGLANYLKATTQHAAARGVVIGFDGRKNSYRFAQDAAQACSRAGLQVHLFNRAVPTPVVAFAVQDVHAAAGIMVTASHNPPNYNGCKIFAEDGAQIIAPHDQAIERAIDAIAAKMIDWQELPAPHSYLDERMYQHYLQTIVPHTTHSNTSLVIAYTPLHGVGVQLAEAALQRSGFKHIYTVAQQREPDAHFSTLASPNPEDSEAMQAVLELGKHVHADIVCANDPDADRLAIAVRDDYSHDYIKLTGDQLGILLADYILQHNRYPADKSLVGNTIVSSSLLEKLAHAYGVRYYKTLTGFKWLAQHAKQYCAAGMHLLFAYEEALGFGVNASIHDKDGISALVMFANLAQHSSPLQRLMGIYQQHGLHITGQATYALHETKNLQQQLRMHMPTHMAGKSIVRVDDFTQQTQWQLPPSDVLIFYLADNTRIAMRASGTEPKMKCYYEMIVPCPSDKHYGNIHNTSQLLLNNCIEQHRIEIENMR